MTVRPTTDREQGQILVIFAISLVVIMAIGALLYSGASALVTRRQLQDGGDAAALAAANILPAVGTGTCTSARIAPRSAPSTHDGGDLYEKALANVETNLGWTDAQVAARMTVSCPTNSDYQSFAIQVNLSSRGPGYFGAGNLSVATSSVAINGAVGSGGYSVALLDPSHITWPSTRRGCPSFHISGSVTVSFEGSIMVDSSCSAADGGALKAIDSGLLITMVNSSPVRVFGEYYPGTQFHFTPAPVQHSYPFLFDPLSRLVPPCNSVDGAGSCAGSATTLPQRRWSGGSAICKNIEPCIITPGTYTDGISIGSGGQNPNTVLVCPGVYYIRGSGISFGSASARMYAIPNASVACGGAVADTTVKARYNPTTACSGLNSTACTTLLGQRWEQDCPSPTATVPSSPCGVLVYNAPGGATWNTTQDKINVGAQGSFELRAYDPSLDRTNGTLFEGYGYKNMVIWQSGTPAPSGSGRTQPEIQMAGGGCVTLSGTVYAPGAKVDFGGGSCGSGGGDSTLSLQFIAWDLDLSGNNSFYFAYQKAFFVKPTGYGLIQ